MRPSATVACEPCASSIPAEQDWSLEHSLELKVQPGEIYELSAWVRVRGAGSVTLGVVTRDAAGKTIDWAYGGRSTAETKAWRFMRSRFIVPPETATIWPRLIGDGPATVWCDDFVLTRQGSLAALRGQGLPATVTISNAAIDVILQTARRDVCREGSPDEPDWGQRADGDTHGRPRSKGRRARDGYEAPRPGIHAPVEGQGVAR